MNRTDRLDQLTTCSVLLKNIPSTKSGIYNINLQGHSISPLVQLYCDMTSKDDVGVTCTLIKHDNKRRKYADGYEPPGSYERKIKYELSMEHIAAIMKQSNNCEQLIKC